MSEEDIYRPPESSGLGLQDQAALGELMRGWEKMRLRYNLILLPFGLITLGIWAYTEPSFALALLLPSLAFGVGANLCYLAGPMVELYWRALFLNSEKAPHVRNLLYWGGVVLSIGILLLSILASIPLSATAGAFL